MKQSTLARVSQCCLALLWLCMVSACTPREKLDHPPIKIAVSTTPLSTPFYVAEHLGLLEEYCGNVQLLDIKGGTKSFQTMIEGGADFATSSDSVMVYQSFQRADFVNVTTFVQSVNDIKLLAHKASGIGAINDLKNKTVGYIKGSASDYMLSILMALYDVAKEDVTLVELTAEETTEALLSRKVDAVSTWEPYAFQASKALGEDAMVLDSTHIYSLTFNLLAKGDYVNGHPKNVECLLRALSQAINHISSNPEEAKQVLKNRLNLGDDFIQWVWPDYLFKLSLNNSLVMSMESQQNWLIKNGVFPNTKSPDPRRFIDPLPLQSVIPTAVRF